MKRGIGAVVVLALVTTLSACVPFPHAIETSTPVDVDVADDLLPYYTQSLRWKNCEGGLQCATATVPIDWENPADDSIELALVRSRATGSERLGSLLLNPGGPGASGYDFVAQSQFGGVSQNLQQYYDIVGFDPRGVSRSNPVTCGGDETLDDFLYGDPSDSDEYEEGSDEWLQAGVDSVAEFGAACESATGALFAHMDTESTARDLDLLRAILGDEKLNFLGYSYGSYIGATYAGLYPENVGHLVLDGAIDPSVGGAESSRIDALGFESALRAYVTDCLSRSDCPLGGTVDSAMLAVRALMDSLDESPLRNADGRLLESNTFTTALIAPLYDQGSWPNLDQLFIDTYAGSADVAFQLADQYNDRDYQTGEYTGNLFEAYYATVCLDDSSTEPFDVVREQEASITDDAPVFGPEFGYGGLGCDGWPVTGTRVPAEIHADGSDPILVVGTTNDPATPYSQAVSLADQLDNGYLVTYNGEGHTAYNHSNSCVDDAVDSYFIDGTVPEVDPDC